MFVAWHKREGAGRLGQATGGFTQLADERYRPGGIVTRDMVPDPTKIVERERG